MFGLFFVFKHTIQAFSCRVDYREVIAGAPSYHQVEWSPLFNLTGKTQHKPTWKMYGLISCQISKLSKVIQRIILSLLTCLRVTLRTSPTYMMRPWCRTMPTVMESSHTSDATYLSTWMPKSFSTNRPEQMQKSVSLTPDQQREL